MMALLMGLLGGLALGAVYFGLLWLSVDRGTASRHPAPWMLGGFVIRLLWVAAGFVAVVRLGGGGALLLSLLGFLVARQVALRRWGPGAAHASDTATAN